MPSIKEEKEDFTEEAEKQITEDNVDDEIDALAADIEAGKGAD